MKSIPIRKISGGYKELSVAGGFSIRKIKEVLMGKDVVHGLHKHDFYLILVFERGAGEHQIDFVSYEIDDYSIFILRPGQVHTLKMNALCSGFIVEFDPSFYQVSNAKLNAKWKRMVRFNYNKYNAEDLKRIVSKLSDIYDEYSEKRDGFIDAIKAYLDVVVIEYTRLLDYQKVNLKSEDNYIQQRFEELVILIENNVVKLKNASDYAELLNLSLYQLNAITKASVGKTVSDLINEQILLEAKRFLLATNKQVKDIADELGYEDASYFVRYFKKQTGYTPDVFRKL